MNVLLKLGGGISVRYQVSWWLDPDFQCEYGPRIRTANTDRESAAYRSIGFVRSFKQEVSEKSDHRDNWFVAAKRS